MPGTRSIAAEFVEAPHLVVELLRCENATFHVHAAPFGIWSHHLTFVRDRIEITGSVIGITTLT